MADRLGEGEAVFRRADPPAVERLEAVARQARGLEVREEARERGLGVGDILREAGRHAAERQPVPGQAEMRLRGEPEQPGAASKRGDRNPRNPNSKAEPPI